MIRAYDRAFKQTPDVLNGVGMDIAINPFLGTMADSFVPCIVVGNSPVSRPIIGVNGFGIWCFDTILT